MIRRTWDDNVVEYNHIIKLKDFIYRWIQKYLIEYDWVDSHLINDDRFNLILIEISTEQNCLFIFINLQIYFVILTLSKYLVHTFL